MMNMIARFTLGSHVRPMDELQADIAPERARNGICGCAYERIGMVRKEQGDRERDIFRAGADRFMDKRRFSLRLTFSGVVPTTAVHRCWWSLSLSPSLWQWKGSLGLGRGLGRAVRCCIVDVCCF